MKIHPIPGYLKIKHPFCIEKNSHRQAHAGRTDTNELSSSRSSYRSKHIISDTSYLRSCLFPARDGGTEGDGLCDNRIVYEETPDTYLPSLASSIEETMNGRKSPIILRPRFTKRIGMSIIYTYKICLSL